MPVRVRCPNSQCQQIANVPDAAIGKSAKCRSCGTTFVLRPIEESTDGAAVVSLSILNEAPPEAPKAPPPIPQAAPVSPAVAPGTTIGRFEVRKELGSGAFGTVYLAFDPQLQRDVALKVPNRVAQSSSRRIERFLREARAAAKLRHPNIVPVYDSGQTGDQHYIASAFVRGEPLGEIIEDGGIDLRRGATIVRSIAEGLAYAHREGIVHRDVKPANVMLDEDGQPLLMDFGLAAEVDSVDEFRLPEDEADDRASKHDDSRLTRAGSVMGTPSYMAPEIAKGHRGEAQPASDQYALGVVLYELLTGQTPFEGPPAAVLHQVIHDTPPKPSSIRKDLPQDLEAICLTAMAKDPGDRYVTCAAMADDLRRWLDGEPIKARRPGFVARTKRLIKQEPMLALGSAGVVVAALVMIGVLVTLWSVAIANEKIAAANTQDAKALAAESEAKRLADQEAAERAKAQQKADADFALAQEKTIAGDWNGAWGILNGIPIELRNPAWAILMAEIDGFPEFRRVIQSGPVIALDFDVNSRHILQVAQNGDLIVWDVWTTREARRLPLYRTQERQFWHAAAMSADARRVATFASPENQPGFAGAFGGGIAMPAMPNRDQKGEPRKAEVVIWDENAKVIRTIPAIDAPLRLAMSRNGSLLAIAGGPHDGQQTLAIWNVNTGERIVAMDKVLSVLPGPTFAMAFSPDGTLFAATTIQEGGEIRVWDTASGAERLVIKDRTAVITHLAFSPDGTRLAAAGGGVGLVGPVRTEKVRKCVPVATKMKVMRDGKEVDVVVTSMKCFEEQVEIRGFHYPKMKTVYRTECVQETAMRTVQKAESKLVKETTYETRTETIERDGKKETVEKKVPVVKERTITYWVPVQETYTVSVNKRFPQTQMDIDPVVRVWVIDGGALQTTITETSPVTALAWRHDGAVLATGTGLDNLCDGAPDCSDCGGFHGGYGMPTPVPAAGPPPIGSSTKARDMRRLLALMLTCFGHYGGPGTDCLRDRAKVSLWDPATGKRLIDLPTPTAPVTSIAFSLDNQHIAAGNSNFDGGITLWSLASRYLIANGRGDGPITKLLFSQDNARLASFSNCNNVSRLWDVGSGSLVKRFDAGSFMQFLPSSRFLAHVPGSMAFHGYSCGPESEVSSLGRWLSRDGVEEKHPGDRDDVLVYSEDGNRLVAEEVMPEMRLVVVNALAGTQVCALEQSSEAIGALKLQISRDGSRIAAVTPLQELPMPPAKEGDDEPNAFAMTQYAMLWDGQTGKLLARKPDAFATDLSADGKRWVVATRKNIAPVRPAIVPAAPPKAGPPKEVPKEKIGAIDAPGLLLVTQEDPEPKKLPKTTPPAAPAPKVADEGGSPLPPQAWPVFMPQYELTLFDGDGKEIKKLPGGDNLRSLAFDPTGRCLIGIAADIVKVWNVESGQMIAQYRTNDEHVAVSPDGRFLAIHRRQPVQSPVRPKEMKTVMPKAQAPRHGNDDRLLAMFADPLPPGPPMRRDADAVPQLEPPFPNGPEANGARKTMWITVIDLASGKPVWNASVFGTGHGSMAFSHDGSRLALGYVDGKPGYVQVWDTKAPASGEPFQHQFVAKYTGHYGAVHAVAFSPDGTKLASGGDDKVVKIWRLPAAGKRGPGADGPTFGAPVVVEPAGPPIAPTPKPRRSFADPAGERKAAEAARALQATVLVLNEFGELSTQAADKSLPEGPFGLLGIVLEKVSLGGQTELRQLASSKELREMVLSNCYLNDDSLATVRDLSVNKLNLQGTSLNDKHIGAIVSANKLEWLSVQWTGRGTDADCEKFAALSNLKTLVLNDCPLTHKACASIARLKNLENLQVTGVQLSGSDFAALRALPKLKVLNLHKSNISDADIEAIKALPLETLNLEFNRITPACLKWLKEMRTLKTLTLEEKVFSPDDIADFRKSLPGCRVVLVN